MQYRAVPRRNPLCTSLLVGSALCIAGCGAGDNVKKYDVTYGQGHFRGVIYANETPAPGENPIYTVDFTQPTEVQGAVIKEVSTYQSTTEATGGQIDGLFGYSNNGTIPLENLIFSETHYKNVPTPTPDHATTYQSFYVSFGPPTNNGTHFDGVLIEVNICTDSRYGDYGCPGQRHKAVFDKVP